MSFDYEKVDFCFSCNGVASLGDINLNGEIDSLDYILLKRAYFDTYKIR